MKVEARDQLQMTNNEFRYFLKCQKNSHSFIESYLFSACNGDEFSQEVEFKIKEIEVDGNHLEEVLFEDLLKALLPYFSTSKSASSNQLKISTQNELYLEQKNDINFLNYSEDSDETWAGETRVLSILKTALQRIQHYKWIPNHLNKLFPMICQVLDDYRAENKEIGVELAKEFLRLVPGEVILKFNLHSVIYESLKVNVSFDSLELIRTTFDLWIVLIEKTEPFSSKSFLKRSDELLLLLCRDIGITSKIDRIVVFLDSLKSVLKLMQFCAIRYLRKVVVSLCEVVKENWTSDSVVRAGESAMIVLIQNCWIRISEDLKGVILNTFEGNKEVVCLLDSIAAVNE